MLRYLVFWFCSWCIVHSIHAQPQRVERIGAEQGLMTSEIYSFAQDHDGFIWLSTKRNGLLRYDGHKFVPLEWEGGTDLTSVNHYKVASDGYRYIAAEKNGVVQIAPSGSSKVFETNAFDEQFYLPTFFQDSAHKIWILSYGQGLSYIEPADGSIKTYVHDPSNPNSLSDDQLYDMVEDDAGLLWIATENGGLSCLDPKTGLFTNYKYDPAKKNGIPGDQVYGVQVDHEQRIWISIYGKGIAYLDKKKERFVSFTHSDIDPTSLSSNLVWPILLDGEKGLYIGTQDNGLDYLDFQSMSFSNIGYDPNDETTVAGSRVVSLFVDQESNLWVSSDKQGVSFYNRAKDIFQRIAHDPFDKKSIKSNDILYIEEDEYGHIWISYTEDGVTRIDANTGEKTHFSINNRAPYSLSDDNTLHLYCDQKGYVWVGTKFGGLNRINTKTLAVRSYLTNETQASKGPFSNWVKLISRTSSGAIWVYSNGALSIYNLDEDRFEHIALDKDPNNPLTPSGNIMQSIIEDENENLWFVTEEGVEKYDKASRTFELIDRVFFPWYANKNTMWYSTQGVLSKFDLLSEEVTDFDMGASVIINDVVEDAKGDLWISCNDGIRKLNLQTKDIKLIKKDDGLISNKFINGSFCSKFTGDLYFNSEKGINVFHPDEVSIDSFLPNIKVVSLSYFDRKTTNSDLEEYENIENVSAITLPYYNNIINVEFAALSYKKPKKNQYQYRIKELSDSWINLGTDRSISFTNLSPQEYNLEIMGSNGDGVWNQKPATLKIIISPPWYASWWAYISYVLLGLFVIWQFILWREREQKRKLQEEKRVVERLKEVDRLKDVFLANTSHELRTPLNGIIGLSESMRDGIAGAMSDTAVSNLNMIINSGKRLAHLVNDILDFSKLKDHDLVLNITAVDLKSAVDLVVALSKTEIDSKDLNIVNDIDEELSLVEADENRLQQILHNLIGNAIKFTKEGSVEISAYQDGGFIRTTIKDTGIGIPEDKIDRIFRSFDQVDSSIERKYGGTGLGLSISKQLIERHGGSIKVESEFGIGTELTFSLKVSPVTRDERAIKRIDKDTISTIVDYHQTDHVEVEEKGIVSLASKGVNILVVDDEPVNRQVLANFLKLEGYTAHLAENGIVALDILSKTEINLILLDVMMPGMSGYEVAKKVRETYLPSILPIIMLTSKNGIDDLVTGFNAGANDYLSKPFVRKELFSRIQNHLNLQKIIKTSAQFVPDAFIRSLGRQSITDVQLGDFAEKKVTVLFTDIRNYTGLSERMTPKDNFEFVRSYVSKMGPVIQKNNGFVNQYLGDGIMCIFDKGVESALHASIEMQSVIVDYNKMRAKKNRPLIEVGMGHCTGPLVMGIIGDEMRKDSTTISSTVNLASRFEGLTKLLGAKILFDKNEYTDLDHDQWHIRNLGWVKVRGQEEPQELLECYASDDPEVQAAKINNMAIFNEAISSLAQGKEEESLVILRDILKKAPRDQVVSSLINHVSNKLLTQHHDTNKWLLDFS